MAVDKLIPDDPRIQRKTANLNGRTYGYLLGEPQSPRRGTIFLCHGFPDLSFGWRYQIPMLLKMGLRVVAPDMMGYGMTDAPPYTLQDYGFKRAADDVKELATQLGENQILLCGHDWGAATAYRIALYHPTLIRALITLAIPYIGPSPLYVPLPLLLRSGRAPTVGYQLQLASGTVEEHVSSSASPASATRQALLAFYGARTSSSPGGRPAFSSTRGLDLSSLADLQASTTPLITSDELSYYVREYTRAPHRHPLHGPLNWYRTREVNYLDELQAGFIDPPSLDGSGKPSPAPKVKIECPTLFIAAQRDVVFPFKIREGTKEDITVGKAMADGVPNLTAKCLDSSHWIAWERAEDVNRIVKAWLSGLGLGLVGDGELGGGGRGGGSQL